MVVGCERNRIIKAMKGTIDEAGRVVIPKAIREAAGLKPGTPLMIEYRNGRVEIERKSPEVRFWSGRAAY